MGPDGRPDMPLKILTPEETRAYFDRGWIVPVIKRGTSSGRSSVSALSPDEQAQELADSIATNSPPSSGANHESAPEKTR